MADTNTITKLARQLRRFEATADSDDALGIKEKFKKPRRLLKITADGLEDYVAGATPLTVPHVQIFIDAASFLFVDELVPSNTRQISTEVFKQLLRTTLAKYTPKDKDKSVLTTMAKLVRVSWAS